MNLKKIYKKIPKVTGCTKGCTECCGPVPCTREEFYAIPDIPEKLSPVCNEQGERVLVCRFESETGCLIYEHRPLVCRLFGAVNEAALTCPRGAKAARPLSLKKAKMIVMKTVKDEHFLL